MTEARIVQICPALDSPQRTSGGGVGGWFLGQGTRRVAAWALMDDATVRPLIAGKNGGLELADGVPEFRS